MRPLARSRRTGRPITTRHRGRLRPRHPRRRACARRPVADRARGGRRARCQPGHRERGVAGASPDRAGRLARAGRHLRPRDAARLAEPAPTRTRRRQPDGLPLDLSRGTPDPALLPVARSRVRPGLGPSRDPASTRTSRCCPRCAPPSRRPGPTPPRRSRSSTAPPTASAGALEQCVSLRRPGGAGVARLPAVLRPGGGARRRDRAGRARRSTACAPTPCAARWTTRPVARRAAATRAEPHRHLDDARARADALGRAARPPAARAPWMIEDDHSGAISTASRRLARRLAARAGGARAQLLQVARPRPAHRRPRRAGRPGRPAGRPPDAGARLDLADAADDPARPAHRVALDGRGRRGPPSVLRAAADLVARAGRPRRRPSPPPTASTCGCRSPTSARRCCTWPPPASASRPARLPRRRRPGAPHVRVTTGLVDPEHAAEVAAALAAAAPA